MLIQKGTSAYFLHLQLHTFEFGIAVKITIYSHQITGLHRNPATGDQKGWESVSIGP
jgi:hypothetical protein